MFGAHYSREIFYGCVLGASASYGCGSPFAMMDPDDFIAPELWLDNKAKGFFLVSLTFGLPQRPRTPKWMERSRRR
jgi:hypothetical protein